jgi:hypothetical protein
VRWREGTSFRYFADLIQDQLDAVLVLPVRRRRHNDLPLDKLRSEALRGVQGEKALQQDLFLRERLMGHGSHVTPLLLSLARLGHRWTARP